MTLTRHWIGSPNYSSRGGTAVRLIVLHTAEGALTYQSLGNFFAGPSSGVSSHVGIDDTPGTVGEYVHRPNKAWTQADANPYCVAAELCAFAAWTTTEWDRHPNMLANCAAWVAEEAQAFGIPIRVLTPAEAQGGAAGVCQHVDLGAAGGNHWDCGGGFPIQRVIDMARGEGDDMTPEQDQMLRAVHDQVVHGRDILPSGAGYGANISLELLGRETRDRLVDGVAELVPGGFGSLLSLEALLRETVARLDTIERQLRQP